MACHRRLVFGALGADKLPARHEPVKESNGHDAVVEFVDRGRQAEVGEDLRHVDFLQNKRLHPIAAGRLRGGGRLVVERRSDPSDPLDSRGIAMNQQAEPRILDIYVFARPIGRSNRRVLLDQHNRRLVTYRKQRKPSQCQPLYDGAGSRSFLRTERLLKPVDRRGREPQEALHGSKVPDAQLMRAVGRLVLEWILQMIDETDLALLVTLDRNSGALSCPCHDRSHSTGMSGAV